MQTSVASTDWRSGVDQQQPVGRHRMSNDSGASARVHTEFREEPVRHQMTMDRHHAHPLSRLVAPVSASRVRRTQLDAALLDLLD
jgi:hypothetical protein